MPIRQGGILADRDPTCPLDHSVAARTHLVFDLSAKLLAIAYLYCEQPFHSFRDS